MERDEVDKRRSEITSGSSRRSGQGRKEEEGDRRATQVTAAKRLLQLNKLEISSTISCGEQTKKGNRMAKLAQAIRLRWQHKMIDTFL